MCQVEDVRGMCKARFAQSIFGRPRVALRAMFLSTLGITMPGIMIQPVLVAAPDFEYVAPATAETTVEFPSLQAMEKTVELQRLQVVEKTVGVQHLQFAEKTVKICGEIPRV